MSENTLTPAQAQEGAPEWRLVGGRLMLSVRFADFATALAFVGAVGAVAEDQDHHPEVDLRWGRVVLAVASHDVHAITERDLRLVRAVTPLVADYGGTAEHPRLSEVEIAIVTVDPPRIRPFWAAVLGLRDSGTDALSDPQRRLPSVRFEQDDAPGAPSRRMRLDVCVPHDVAESRVAAALAAGGVLVSDANARAARVVADADGNEACVRTWHAGDG